MYKPRMFENTYHRETREEGDGREMMQKKTRETDTETLEEREKEDDQCKKEKHVER